MLLLLFVIVPSILALGGLGLIVISVTSNKKVEKEDLGRPEHLKVGKSNNGLDVAGGIIFVIFGAIAIFGIWSLTL